MSNDNEAENHNGFRGLPTEQRNIPAFRIIHGTISVLKILLGCEGDPGNRVALFFCVEPQRGFVKRGIIEIRETW